MDQGALRYAVAGIVILLFVWMAGFGLFMRARGVAVNAVAEPNTNWLQRALLAGAGLFDFYLVLRAPFPVLDAWFRTAPAPFALISLCVLAAGGVLIAAAQSGMGRSWRVGVPKSENHVDELVTTGLNRFSRNPVYLGIMVFLIGAALAAPGPFSGAVLVASVFGLTAIIRQEERYLSKRFGARYEDYKKRVRRWI